MNLHHFHQKLLEKQSEFQMALSALESEAQGAATREVRDSMDDASAAQNASEALSEGAIVSQTLEEVQDALRRIDSGTYGTCIVCDRQIELARLEAIPWAARCLEDQAQESPETNDEASEPAREGVKF